VRVPEPGGKRQFAMLHWGLIPPWAKDAKIAYSTINAHGDQAGVSCGVQESPRAKMKNL
jgi:putative SOS response-associated peptidase YedK